MKSYLQNKINQTDGHFLEKIKSLIFVLLFLNFTIWSSFHSSHHLFSSQNLDPKLEDHDLVHVHSDGKVHNHSKTSSSNHKKHQEQSNFYCLLLNFNSHSEKFLFSPLQKIISKNNYFISKIIYYKSFQIKKCCLNKEIIPRAPPNSINFVKQIFFESLFA